ncbi:MAG TPA: cytochrome c biogenesis CcdA family protein [Candidatus Deferrimicrobium sp.]|nr:cytochrome c biogenesis CcdA family protein [Candidatus Deferrimicrobium sp.]
MDLTLGVALLAGLISFLSPCVLPVVPAYLGQLGILAVQNPLAAPAAGLLVAGAAAGALPMGGSAGGPLPPPGGDQAVRRRVPAGWRAMPNAFAFVLGFSVVFTVLGVAAYFVAGPLRDNLPLLRQVGGIILVILGLNLMGVLRLRTLARSWKPLERFGGEQPGARRGGVVGGFALGSVFALGWTPCIGPTLGAILTMAAVGTSPQVVSLLLAYSIGLGIPFILMALAVDRAPLITRPLLRYSRQIEIAGGALIVFLGLALIFDWLGMFARTFSFLWPSV